MAGGGPVTEQQPQAEEIDRWAVWRNHKRCEGFDCDHPYHLLATVARQAEQIERLQRVVEAAKSYRDHRHVVCMPCMDVLREALAALEPGR